MVERESATELEARRHLERILDCELSRVTPDDRPSPDYTFFLSDGQVAAVEVKEIVSSDLRQLSAGHDRYETERAVSELERHWTVMLDGEIAAERLGPVPDFPHDDEKQIAELEAAGFIVTRRAERVAEFKRQRDEVSAAVRVKGLIDDLVPDLKMLEDRGISTTRGAMPTDAEGQRALWRIAHRTRDAICLGGEAKPEAGMPAGVFVTVAYGSLRTGLADTVADRIDAWFESSRSANLIKSLSRPEYAERHAALVFDPTEPELWSSAESLTFVPSQGLDLPAGVDVLWAVLRSRVLRYSVSDGWREYVVGGTSGGAPEATT